MEGKVRTQSQENNRLNCLEYYDMNKPQEVKRKTLARILKGVDVKPKTMGKQQISRDDFKEEMKKMEEFKKKVHANVLSYLLGERKVDEPLPIIGPRLSFPKAEMEKGGVSLSTLDKYKAHLNGLMTKMKIDDENVFYYQMENAEKFISDLKKHYPLWNQYKPKLNVIRSMFKHSEVFQLLLKDAIKHYDEEWEKVQKLQKEGEEAKIREGKLVVTWVDLVAVRKALENDNNASDEYLLMCLYTLIPTIRDNWGNVRIYSEEQKFADGREHDYYCRKQGIFYLYTQKYAKNKGLVKIDIRSELNLLIGAEYKDKLYDVIEQSLKRRPRSYLITQEKSDQPYADGKLSAKVKKMLDMSINDIRHALSTYIDSHPTLSVVDKMALHRASLHSVEYGMKYVREDGQKKKIALKEKPQKIPIKPKANFKPQGSQL